MAGFLYFKPGTTQTVTKQLVDEWGLGYAFTGAPTGTICQGDTPNGSNGVVFGDEKRLGDYQPIMQMAEQEWVKSADGDWYIGYWKAAQPTPDDLARPTQLRGYLIEIGGREWLIPLTAKFDDESQSLTTALPCNLKYSGKGHWTKGDVLKIHRKLWEIGQSFRDDFINRYVHQQPARDFTDDEIGEAVYFHLHANYVIGRDELSLMEVISGNDPGAGAAIMMANDMPTLLRWSEQRQKKTESATEGGLTIADGEAA